MYTVNVNTQSHVKIYKEVLDSNLYEKIHRHLQISAKHTSSYTCAVIPEDRCAFSHLRRLYWWRSS